VTKAEWESCDDPEPMVRLLLAKRHQRELRLFSTSCVRRVWSLLPNEFRQAVEMSERFAQGQAAEADLVRTTAVADELAQRLWPGSHAPDAVVYAASAAIDASTVWPRTTANVLAATTCAASAFARSMADAVNDTRHDAVFAGMYRAELAVQAGLLRGLIAFPFM
jgi:hypothetical protein